MGPIDLGGTEPCADFTFPHSAGDPGLWHLVGMLMLKMIMKAINRQSHLFLYLRRVYLLICILYIFNLHSVHISWIALFWGYVSFSALKPTGSLQKVQTVGKEIVWKDWDNLLRDILCRIHCNTHGKTWSDVEQQAWQVMDNFHFKRIE